METTLHYNIASDK